MLIYLYFNVKHFKKNIIDIKEKLKLLTQKRKLLLNETKIKKFESEVNEIDRRRGALRYLKNYKNIINLEKSENALKSEIRKRYRKNISKSKKEI